MKFASVQPLLVWVLVTLFACLEPSAVSLAEGRIEKSTKGLKNPPRYNKSGERIDVTGRVIEDGPKEIDVEAFLKAHAAGEGDQYKGYLVTGSAHHFSGQESISDDAGNKAPLFTLCPLAKMSTGTIRPIRTLKDWTDAQLQGAELLQVSVRGKNLKGKPGGGLGVRYFFSGTWEGNTTEMTNSLKVVGSEPPASTVPILVDGTISLTKPKAEKTESVPAGNADIEKSAAAMLRLAKSLDKPGTQEKARVRYQELIKKYPDSEAAKEAQKLIGEQ